MVFPIKTYASYPLNDPINVDHWLQRPKSKFSTGAIPFTGRRNRYSIFCVIAPSDESHCC